MPDPTLSLPAVAALRDRLVVSCQAPTGHPLRDTDTIARLALAALLGGAGGLRANGPADVAALRALTELPVIGLHKVLGESRNIITPTFELALGLASAGADIIAIDSTLEASALTGSLLERVQRETGLAVMADISTLDEGLGAWDKGAELVGTTLAGYTPESRSDDDRPALELVERLASRGVRVVAEGRYRYPSEVRAAFDAGAFAVVVGGAITDALAITARFAAQAPSTLEHTR